MFKKIAIALLLLIVALGVVVTLQPADFRISRSTTIAAPAPAVFDRVNDFHQWDAWSPWAKLDPAMKQTHTGAPSGNGAIYAWAGNNKVGEGRMTIVESRPSDLIRIQLEFLKPFAATNTAEFTFKPDGDQTTVTWSMSGQCDFMSKAFKLFVNMDKMIGADFEKGLAQLKSSVEAASNR